MITAHLPAGYVAAAKLDRAFDRDPLIFWAIIAGAVLPDLDMLWFAFVDQGAVHHHSYITHDPTLWIAVLLAGLALTSRLLIGLGIGTLLHLMLDTIVGAVTWGYGDISFSGPLVTVPPTRSHLVLSFLLHWTMLLEAAIWAWAGWVFWQRRHRRRA